MEDHQSRGPRSPGSEGLETSTSLPRTDTPDQPWALLPSTAKDSACERRLMGTTQLEGGITGHVVTTRGQATILHPRVTEAPKPGKYQER